MYQIENPESLEIIDNKQNRENVNTIDTDIEQEKNVVNKTELSTSE